ncbi:MAG: DMT family transporter [Pseudomonadota bacterium]
MRGETYGIALRVLSGVLFTGMASAVKAIGDAAPLGQVVFFRSAIAIIPLVVFLWWRSEFPRGLATRRPLGHLARCLLGGAAMFTSFATLRVLPIAEATMLTYLSPLMTVALAALLLGERPGLRRWFGVGLGCGGILALTVPRFGAESPELLGVGLGLATAALTAGALVQIRALSTTESPGAIAFFFALASAIAGLATAPFGWVAPDAATWAMLVATGLLGGAAHVAMTLSFRYAQASLLAPFEYLTILWAAILGAAVFAETPSGAFLIAAPLIIAGAACASPVLHLGRAKTEVQTEQAVHATQRDPTTTGPRPSRRHWLMRWTVRS